MQPTPGQVDRFVALIRAKKGPTSCDDMRSVTCVTCGGALLAHKDIYLEGEPVECARCSADEFALERAAAPILGWDPKFYDQMAAMKLR